MPDVYDGFSLKNKSCPVCGKSLTADGHNIPTEFFWGLNGEKIPSLDLCFPTSFCENAVKFLEEILGAENIVRVGYIGTKNRSTQTGERYSLIE